MSMIYVAAFFFLYRLVCYFDVFGKFQRATMERMVRIVVLIVELALIQNNATTCLERVLMDAIQDSRVIYVRKVS